MSSPSTTVTESGRLDGVRVSDFLLRPLEAAGFWAAVVLPFVYVPIILAGPDTPSNRAAVGLLLAAHVVALIVGHRHHRR
ncbi:MAG: hypothetical protein ACOCY7_00585 [Halodesulfurarchaeum sp.]